MACVTLRLVIPISTLLPREMICQSATIQILNRYERQSGVVYTDIVDTTIQILVARIVPDKEHPVVRIRQYLIDACCRSDAGAVDVEGHHPDAAIDRKGDKMPPAVGIRLLGRH